mgnify:CR=1 FL=1
MSVAEKSFFIAGVSKSTIHLMKITITLYMRIENLTCQRLQRFILFINWPFSISIIPILNLCPVGFVSINNVPPKSIGYERTFLNALSKNRNDNFNFHMKTSRMF